MNLQCRNSIEIIRIILKGTKPKFLYIYFFEIKQTKLENRLSSKSRVTSDTLSVWCLDSWPCCTMGVIQNNPFQKRIYLRFDNKLKTRSTICDIFYSHTLEFVFHWHCICTRMFLHQKHILYLHLLWFYYLIYFFSCIFLSPEHLGITFKCYVHNWALKKVIFLQD